MKLRKIESLQPKITNADVIEDYQELATHPMQEPHLIHAREKMRWDLSFRNANMRIAGIYPPISEDDFERFTGEQN